MIATLDAVIQRTARTFYPYGAIRTIRRGPLRGLKIKIHPAMGLTYIFGLDTYCWSNLREHIGKYETIYDIGANRGQVSLYLAALKQADAKLYCFEPVRELYEDLCSNLRRNRLPNVECLNVALSDIEGEAEFVYSPEHQTQGKLGHVEKTYSVPGSRPMKVKTATLDGLIEGGLAVPDLLKIDVEGGAASVLRGGRKTLTSHGPDIYIELHGPEERNAVGQEIMSRDYTVEDLDGHRIVGIDSHLVGPLWCYRKGESGPTGGKHEQDSVP